MGDRRRSPGGYRGGRGPPPRGQDRGGYKVICVSSLHKKASDDVVRDTLYREYKRYGDISVRVMHEPDERVAYVYFRLVLVILLQQIDVELFFVQVI